MHNANQNLTRGRIDSMEKKFLFHHRASFLQTTLKNCCLCGKSVEVFIFHVTRALDCSVSVGARAAFKFMLHHND